MPAGGQRGGPDWPRLKQLNPEIEAWLRVAGTAIDLPVAQPSNGRRSDWYLKHDVWGRLSNLGCPYLDTRCSSDDRHLLIYGHRVGDSNLMFTQLAEMYRQEAFELAGEAAWQTAAGEEAFAPFLALRVDMADRDIQHFEFSSKEEFRQWAASLLHRATAKAPWAAKGADRIERVLTLVTCASRQVGGRQRTVVMFASPASGRPRVTRKRIHAQ